VAEVIRAALALVCLGAAAAQAPEVRLEPLATLDAAGGVAHAAAFAPDGSCLVLGGERGDVRCIDLPTGAVRWTVAHSNHWIGVIAFAPDGKTVACKGRRLTLHTVHDGREVADFGANGPRGFAWRTDGAGFAFADDRFVNVVEGRSEVRSTLGFEDPVIALAYAANGDLFAGDNRGRTWRIPAGTKAPTMVRDPRKRPAADTRSIALVLASGQLFDLASDGPLLRGSVEHAFGDSAWSLGVSADGQSFAVGGGANYATWWQKGGEQMHRIEIRGNVNCVAVAPDGESLFVATDDGRQALHRLGEEPAWLPWLPSQVGSFALSPDGSVVAISGSGWILMPVHGGAPRRLAAAVEVAAGRRGSELLVCGEERLAVVDGHSGVEVVGVDVVTVDPSRVAIGPGERFYCGALGALMPPGSGAWIPVPDVLSFQRVCGVDSSHAGLWAVGTAGGIEGDRGALWVTDAEGRTRFQSLDGPVYWVAFSPDGRRLVHGGGRGPSDGSALWSHAVCVRETSDFSVLQESAAHVYGWAWLDDTYALVAHKDGLQVWDARTLKAVHTVRTDALMHGFQTSADRRTIAWTDGRSVFVQRVVLNGR
jgi:WD40 repeat protein